MFHGFDDPADLRSQWMLWIGVWGFWLLCAVAVCGAVLVRRRAMTLAPFIGTVVVSTLAALAGYGLWRLRLPIDVAAVALAGVAVASWSARRPAAENAEAQP